MLSYSMIWFNKFFSALSYLCIYFIINNSITEAGISSQLQWDMTVTLKHIQSTKPLIDCPGFYCTCFQQSTWLAAHLLKSTVISLFGSVVLGHKVQSYCCELGDVILTYNLSLLCVCPTQGSCLVDRGSPAQVRGNNLRHRFSLQWGKQGAFLGHDNDKDSFEVKYNIEYDWL